MLIVIVSHCGSPKGRAPWLLLWMSACALQTNAWMSAQGLKVQLFPPKAADMNPMENLWGILTKKVLTETMTYTNEESLLAAIEAARATIRADRGLRRSIVNSMTGRLQQVIECVPRCPRHMHLHADICRGALCT